MILFFFMFSLCLWHSFTPCFVNSFILKYHRVWWIQSFQLNLFFFFYCIVTFGKQGCMSKEHETTCIWVPESHWPLMKWNHLFCIISSFPSHSIILERKISIFVVTQFNWVRMYNFLQDTPVMVSWNNYFTAPLTKPRNLRTAWPYNTGCGP